MPNGGSARLPSPASLSVDIAELRRKSIPELLALADSLNVPNSSGLRKQDLIYRIEQRLLDGSTTLQAEGVLEILSEGYGFLRAQDWNYLAGPDDIYVSPSQIKRFSLRTGDSISGEVRPPKPWERYLALLRLATINGKEPEADVARRLFDALGVPEARVTYEDEARNTWENALLTRRLVEPKPGDTWLLVTSASHMPRSVGAFRQAGWQVVPWPVNYRTGHGFAALYDAPFLDRLQMFESGLREWLGLVVYRALGRSDALFPAP